MIRGVALFIGLLLLSAPVAFSGEIRVYDANNEFLGIYIERPESYKYKIFIPKLNAFAIIETYRLDGGAAETIADIPRASLYYEGENCTGTELLVPIPQVLIYQKGCGEENDRYFITEGTPVSSLGIKSVRNTDCRCVDATGGSFPLLASVTEIQKEDIPFSLPFALPLHFEYQTSGDFDFDGDIDGVDLMNFAEEFGNR